MSLHRQSQIAGLNPKPVNSKFINFTFTKHPKNIHKSAPTSFHSFLSNVISKELTNEKSFKHHHNLMKHTTTPSPPFAYSKKHPKSTPHRDI